MTRHVVQAKPKARRPPAPPRRRSWVGWLVGILAAGTTLGVGEFVAAFVRPEAAPVIAVGNRIITLTPQSVKEQGIRSAGTNDKLFLILGILVAVALLGAAIGSLALTSLRAGLVGVGLLGAFASYCALTAPAGRGSDVVPTLVGTLAGMAVLVLLIRTHPAADPTRRAFLVTASATVAAAAVAELGGRALQHSRFDVAAKRTKVKLPTARPQTVPAGVDLGKSRVPWATPNGDFYRIDTALVVPQVDPSSWSLRIHGMVDREISLNFAQLLQRPLVERWITLCCVSNEVGGNLVGNALWRGTLLADLLREAGIHDGADQLLMTSKEGMTIGAPAKVVMDGRDALLAVGMNGKPLPVEHGFPVRVVVPGLYGYTSACKWIVDLEVTTFARQSAYWVKGGWEPHPSIKVASRIDTPGSAEVVNVGDTVALAGVAWDQHVGVSRVEVQINSDAWRPARLAAVPSTDTWRQWVLPWTPQDSGTYLVKVRAVDGHGVVQDAKRRDPYPGASSGYHTITLHAVT